MDSTPQSENNTNMFSVFTHRAKNAMKHAKRLVLQSNQLQLDIMHIFYGSVFVINKQQQPLLKSNNIIPDEIKECILKSSVQAESVQGTPYLSEEAKYLVVKSSKTILENFGHRYVSAENLLICVLRSQNAEVAEYLSAHSIDPEKVIAALIEYVKTVNANTTYTPSSLESSEFNISGKQGENPDVPKKAITTKEKVELLKSCGQDLTELAKQNKLQKITGREKELASLMTILLRQKKNNPVLKGESGVGKTAIIEGLAQAIADGNVPESLQNKHLISIEMPSMVAGTKYRGQFEEKLKSIIAAANDPNIILFIDEIHTIVGAGSAEGAIDAGNMLKPALARGLKCIGATTFSEYKKTIEKDAALSRRFSSIIVEEPTIQETISILHKIKPELEKHHNCKYSSEVINAIPRLSNRYMPEKRLPDKAVDIMDEAGACLRIQSHGSKAAMLSLKAELIEAQKEKTKAIENQNYNLAVELRSTEKSIKAQIEKIQIADVSVEKNVKRVSMQTIARVIASETGIPTANITSTEAQKLSKLKNLLRSMVVGQDHAVEKVCDALIQSKLGLKDPERPSSFFLLGPTGVGKTLLSKNIAGIYSDSPNSLINVDMSEHMEKFSVNRMIGSPPGYVGHDESQTLCDQVKKSPHSVILFDEIEKAHPDVLDIMLQILENGTLTDSAGRKIDFSHAIVILTSNLGSSHFSGSSIGFMNRNHIEEDHDKITQQVVAIASKKLRPELINRFDSIIVFKPLSKFYMKNITNMEIQKIKLRLKEQFKKEINVPNNVIEHISEKGFDPKYGARSIRRTVQQELTRALSEFLISSSMKAKHLNASIVDGKILIEPCKSPKLPL